MRKLRASLGFQNSHIEIVIFCLFLSTLPLPFEVGVVVKQEGLWFSLLKEETQTKKQQRLSITLYLFQNSAYTIKMRIILHTASKFVVYYSTMWTEMIWSLIYMVQYASFGNVSSNFQN